MGDNDVRAMPLQGRSGELRSEPVPVSALRAPATIALLPCPFCGGEAETCGLSTGHTTVLCRVCRSEGPRKKAGTPADAIAAWNTRHRTEAQAKLREALLKLADEAAERMWRIHPKELDALDFIHVKHGGRYENPRAAYYASEIMRVVDAALAEHGK